MSNRIESKKIHKYHVRPEIIEIFEPLFSSEVKVSFNKLTILLRKNHQKKSIELIQSEIKKNPDNLELLLIKRLVNCFSEKYSEILDEINDEISLKARKSNFLLYSLHSYIVAMSQMGEGEFEKAIQVADDLINKYPDKSISFGINSIVFGYNFIFEKKKKIENLILSRINQAINLAKDDDFYKSKYLMYKAKIQGLMERYEDSLEAIEQSLNLDKFNISAYYVKISALMSLSKEEEALRFLDDCSKKFPDDKKWFLSKKASFLVSTEHFDEAIEIMEELRVENQDDSGLLCNLGYYYMYIGDTEKSIELINKAIDMDPNNGNLYDSYGEFLLEENRHEEALTKFLTALKMEPDEWFVPYTKVNIASIYVHLGDRENAEKYLNDAKIVITRCACSLHKRDELIKQVEKVREQIKNKQE